MNEFAVIRDSAMVDIARVGARGAEARTRGIVSSTISVDVESSQFRATLAWHTIGRERSLPGVPGGFDFVDEAVSSLFCMVSCKWDVLFLGILQKD